MEENIFSVVKHANSDTCYRLSVDIGSGEVRALPLGITLYRGKCCVHYNGHFFSLTLHIFKTLS